MLTRTPISKGCRAGVLGAATRQATRVLLTRVLLSAMMLRIVLPVADCTRIPPGLITPARAGARGWGAGALATIERCQRAMRSRAQHTPHATTPLPPAGLYIDGRRLECAEGHQRGVQDSHPITIHQSVSSVRDNQLGCICEEQSKSALQ